MSLPVTAAQTPDEVDSPMNLSLVGRVRISATYDFEVIPPYVYALERTTLRVLDARDPQAIREVADLQFEKPRGRIARNGRYIYLTGLRQPLGVVDVSEPSRPRWVAELSQLVGSRGDSFEMGDGVAYLVRRIESGAEAGRMSLDLLDVESDPAHPRRLTNVDLEVHTTGEYGGIHYANGFVYVLVAHPLDDPVHSKLIVVDARKPMFPFIERRVVLPTVFQDLTMRNSWARSMTRRYGWAST